MKSSAAVRIGASRASWGLLLACTLAAASCATPTEKLTPAQFVSQNSNLLEQLGSFVDSEQQEGIARIQRLGRDQGAAVARYILGDPRLDNYRIEVVLARILADWKEPMAIRYLLESLVVLDEGASRRASEGLLAFGDNPQVLAALGEMLSRPVTRERLIAAQTLWKIPSTRVPDMFLEHWKGENDSEVRALFLMRIISSRHPRRRELLIDALTDQDSAIRQEAWRALRKYPDLPGVTFNPDGPIEDRARDVAMLRIWMKTGKK